MFKKIEIILLENGTFEVRVTKTFAPEYGGGEHTFAESGGVNIHRALDVAKGMVTMSRTYNPDAAVDA